MGCHFLLQGILQTRGSNPRLPCGCGTVTEPQFPHPRNGRESCGCGEVGPSAVWKRTSLSGSCPSGFSSRPLTARGIIGPPIKDLNSSGIPQASLPLLEPLQESICPSKLAERSDPHFVCTRDLPLWPEKRFPLLRTQFHVYPSATPPESRY